MSSKLTEKKLLELINEVLQEDISVDVNQSKKDIEKDLGVPGANLATKAKYKDLAGLDVPDQVLDDDDFEKAFAYKSNYKGRKALATNIYNNSSRQDDFKYTPTGASRKPLKKPTKKATIDAKRIDPAKMGNIKPIDLSKSIYEPESIAFGQLANIGIQANPDSPSNIGKFPEGLAASVNTFFKGTSTFKERVDKINKFTELISDIVIELGDAVEEPASLTKIKGMGLENLLAATLFNDYLSTIVTEMDSGSGAYMFETLLAVMAGGNVTGKGDVGDDKVKDDKGSGIMGAVDFVMNDGTYGSAKYYGNVGAGKITQSQKGFQGKKNKPTLYIVAHKKGLGANDTIIAGESDPTKIELLNIYLISVTPLVDKPSLGSHYMVRINGQESKFGTLVGDPGSKLKLTADLSKTGASPIPLIVRYGGEQVALKKAMSIVADNTDTNIKAAYENFKLVFTNLYKVNQKVQRYVSTGDRNVGEEALTTLSTADDRLIDLAMSFKTTTKAKAKDIKTSRKLAEEKKSKKDLDNLIKEVILKRLLK